MAIVNTDFVTRFMECFSSLKDILYKDYRLEIHRRTNLETMRTTSQEGEKCYVYVSKFSERYNGFILNCVVCRKKKHQEKSSKYMIWGIDRGKLF